jgi:threonyl-tRNA synthetase
MAVNEPYKMEILESIKEDPITIYHIGNACHFFYVIFVCSNHAAVFDRLIICIYT